MKLTLTRLVFGILLITSVIPQLAQSQTGSVDIGFDTAPLIKYPVAAITIQSDGRLLVGGEFRKADGSALNFLVRLNQDASLDPSFSPGNGPDGPVQAIVLQPDGKILIGGNFSRVNGFQSVLVARLGTNGTVDQSFVSGLVSVGRVRAMALQADGKVIVAGDDGLQRLLPNGAADPGFQPLSSYQWLMNADGSITTANLIFTGVQALEDGHILISGAFPAILGAPRGGLVRLNPNGSLDLSFSLAISVVDAFVRTPESNIIVSVNLTDPFNVHQLLRLHPDGSLDSSFAPSPTLNSQVRGLKLQADGKIVVTGDFREVGGLRRVGVARFNVDGTLDPAIDSGLGDNTQILALAFQADQKILVGGYLNWPNTFTTRWLLRLNNDTPSFAGKFEFGQGTLSVAENALSVVVPVYRHGGTNGTITVQFATSGGSAVIGQQYTPQSGTLTFAPGQRTNAFSIPIFDDHVVQTNSYFQQIALQLSNPSGGAGLGSQASAVVTIVDVDTALQFGTSVSSTLEADLAGTVPVVRVGNPQTAVGVQYGTADGTARAGLDYVAQSGLLSFAPGEMVKTLSVPLMPGTSTNPVDTLLLKLSDPTGGATLGQLSNTTLRIVQPIPGAPDSIFAPATNVVGGNLIVAQGDGKVILVANVSGTQGGYGPSFVRLNPNGSLDSSFSLTNGLTGSFLCAALQGDGKLIVGGQGLVANAYSRGSVVRLNSDGSLDDAFDSLAFPASIASVRSLAVQADGKILISGDSFSYDFAPTNVARLNQDGSMDTSFQANVKGPVSKVLLQPDDQVLICGQFTQVAGATRGGLARLNADGSLNSEFIPAIALGSYGFPNVLLQTDGRMLVNAGIQLSPGTTQLQLLRLNSDGSLDHDFSSAYATEETRAIAVQAGGKIFVGYPSGDILRLNSDGSLDPTWNAGSGADHGYISSLALEPDGRLLVGGAFATINGIPRAGIAALRNDSASAAGRLGFTSSLIAGVEGITTNVLFNVKRTGGSNGVVSANFAVSGGTALAGVNYVPTSGTLIFGDGDTAEKQFSLPLLDDGVAGEDKTITLWLANALGGAVLGEASAATCILLENDVNIQFATNTYFVNEIEGSVMATVRRFGRLNDRVTVDYATADGSAQAGLAYVPRSGRLQFGPGETSKTITVSIINTVWPDYDKTFFINLSDPSSSATLKNPSSATVKIFDNHRPGTLDQTFNAGAALYGLDSISGPGLRIEALAVQSDGKLLVGGDFFCAVAGFLPWNGLARLLPDGMVDTTLSATFTLNLTGAENIGEVRALAIQPDGKILAGGRFNFVNGNTAQNITRLYSNGTADPSFQAPFNTNANNFQGVFAIGLQADGKVLLAGELPDPNSLSIRHLLVRLNTNGTSDNTLTLSADLTNSFLRGQRLQAVLVQPDQKLIIAGAFPGVPNRFRNGLVRLLPDGAIDSTFSAGPPVLDPIFGTIEALALQPDGKILVGGNFVQFDAMPRSAIVRLNSDGSLDLGFNQVGANSAGLARWQDISTIALQSDGKIIVGGTFVRTDGTWQNAVGRLNLDGSVDDVFDSNGTIELQEYFSQVAVLTDGQVVVAGTPVSMPGIAGGVFRLNGGELLIFQSIKARSDGSVELNLTVPIAGRYVLETSSNLIHWTSLSTNTLPRGAGHVVDSSAPQIEQRFYRIAVSH